MIEGAINIYGEINFFFNERKVINEQLLLAYSFHPLEGFRQFVVSVYIFPVFNLGFL